MKKILLALSVVAVANATTLSELFDALKHHSVTQSDELGIKKAQIYEDIVHAKLYPAITLFAKYDNYSTPTNMRPFPPAELKNNPTMAQPFSYNILKEGINVGMPLFVKSIFTSANQAKMMQQSAKAKKRVNLLQNEALIVGSNANLLYLLELERSLNLKAKSLLETQKTIKIKVDNGRTPASAMYKIEDQLNQINISTNTIHLQKQKLLSTIETLTGIRLIKAVRLEALKALESNNTLAALEPLRKKVEASKLSLKVQKDKLYPSLSLYGSYVYSQGNAYNNDKDVDTQYGNVGVALTMPLFTKTQYTEIEKSKIELMESKNALQKSSDALSAKAQMLKYSLPLLKNSITLSKKSIDNKIKLLRIAKANYKSGRLSTEEYLRYEDEVVSAKAKLYQAKAQKWQTLMELAVIYGNNIEEMVK